MLCRRRSSRKFKSSMNKNLWVKTQKRASIKDEVLKRP